MDNSASFAGEVERNVRRDNDFLLCGQLLKTPPLSRPVRCVKPAKARGSDAVSLLELGQLRSEVALTTFAPLRIVVLRSRLVGAV